MLSALLNNIVTWFSKTFLIASFLPVLAFTFMNGFLAYLFFDAWREWCDQNLIHSSGAGQLAFLTSVLVIALVLISYLVSSISNFLRQIMEGNWFDWLVHIFAPAQEKRLANLEQKIIDAVKTQDELSDDLQRLASSILNEKSQKYKKSELYVGDEQLERSIDRLQRMRSQNQLLDIKSLDHALTRFSQLIAIYNINASASAKRPLFRCHTQLHDLMNFGMEQATLEYVRLTNILNSSFGTYLAPTRMGNIANSIQAYTERRYRCNLNSIVSNLLWCIQQNSQGNTALQDAKTQLDFLILSSYLTGLWTLIWLCVLGVFHSSVWFIAIALGGPVITYCWYLAASEQYRAFNDVLSTSLDIYRFDLLKALRMPIPVDVQEERLIWGQLDKLADTEGGERINFRYENPSK
jgi:hypothetical protein